jgi:glycosyltransferase involved in cell wall biosynthesis
MLIARLLTKGGVIHYHTSRVARDQAAADWRYRVVLLIIRLAAGVVVLENRSYTCLQTVLSLRKLRKIPNMIDLEFIDKIALQASSGCDDASTPRDVNLVFVGHVVPEKGAIELVQACARIKNVRLRLVGPFADKFRVQLEQLALSRKEGQWLQFLGAVDREEVFRQIIWSDILVLPSHAEAFPVTVLEGMALSKPVVATDVGAMSEMLHPDSKDICGVCVVPQNAESLRAGLQGLLASPAIWRELGRRGRKRVETLYSISPVVNQLTGLWREVAGLESLGGELHQGNNSRKIRSDSISTNECS